MLKAPNFIDIDNLSGHHEGNKKINNWSTLVHTDDDDDDELVWRRVDPKPNMAAR